MADLLGRMTLEEQAAKLVCLWDQKPQTGAPTGHSADRGGLSLDKARVALRHGIGQIARTCAPL